jgi:hypothetical protein
MNAIGVRALRAIIAVPPPLIGAIVARLPLLK